LPWAPKMRRGCLAPRARAMSTFFKMGKQDDDVGLGFTGLQEPGEGLLRRQDLPTEPASAPFGNWSSPTTPTMRKVTPFRKIFR
jgi:hypothetical protein